MRRKLCDRESLTVQRHFFDLSSVQGSRRPIEAFAFDLDSTLTRPYLDFSRLRATLGCPEGDILRWAEALPERSRIEALAVIAAFEEDGVEQAEWNDGAEQTLAEIQGLGFPVAIITRNSRASLIAVSRQLGIRVNAMVSRDDAAPKPNPAGVRLAATALGVEVRAMLMVGDFRHDIQAGRAAGAMTVLLTNGKDFSSSVKPDLIISRLPELLVYIETETFG